MAPRGRGRSIAWPEQIAQARRRAAAAWPPSLAAWRAGLWRLVRGWALAEVTPGRLVPFLPVAFGGGICLYFAAAHEPSFVAAAVLASTLIIVSVLVRRQPIAFPVLVGTTAAACGFAVAIGKALLVAHPVLAVPVYTPLVAGYVEVSEERERSDRITLRVVQGEFGRRGVALTRVRIAVRKGAAPAVGRFVALKARLSPPLAPLRPGGYDFARDMYFQGIGASGFVLGRIQERPPPVPPGAWLRYATWLQGLRDAIDARIRAAVPGDAGAIASALITGKRDAISTALNDAMYVSSLAHVLSISGYHMAVVAGVVFFVLRALLALVPALAQRRPIKKWAALAALVATTFYLLLSGSEVATQRSWVMIAIVLVGVMLDRPALTFRTLAMAALGVLALQPEAVVHPSFQMSFAATLALVAAYRNGLPWLRADADTPRAARLALWGGREVLALIVASLVAGLATTPYAAYHFHRLAPYGVVANLLAMPVISAFVMPAGLLALLAMPFGFDHLFWPLMGYGIDWMDAVALWVAALPGAVGRIQAFGTGPLLLVTVGMLLICLLRTPLRWGGMGLAFAAVLWAYTTPRPDIRIAADGAALAVRGADGRLAMVQPKRDRFTAREWLGADADARSPDDKSLNAGVRCDSLGCIARLADGRTVALDLSVDAFEEDCARAAVVASPRDAPGPCAARTVIDRAVWRARGAVALTREGDGFRIEAARPPGYDRPWAPAAANGTRIELRSGADDPSSDATPSAGDRAADD